MLLTDEQTIEIDVICSITHMVLSVFYSMASVDIPHTESDINDLSGTTFSSRTTHENLAQAFDPQSYNS